MSRVNTTTLSTMVQEPALDETPVIDLDSSMEQLSNSCSQHYMYPHNLIGHKPSKPRLEAYINKLSSREKQLFSSEGAKVDVLTVKYQSQGYERVHKDVITSLDVMKELLPTYSISDQHQSQIQHDQSLANCDAANRKCRYFFIQARDSRSPLRISRDLLEYLFSFYQVPPSFLNSVFSFGARVSANFHDISALRVESRLQEEQRGPEITSLRRSGLDIRVCYTLRSVEQSINQVPLPWSIRQTAIYHSFDLLTEEALWINIKGNQLLETRIEESIIPDGPADTCMQSPFAASLSVHLIFAEWSVECWGSYIDDIEAHMQRLTLRTIIDPVFKPAVSVNQHVRNQSQSSIPTASDASRSPKHLSTPPVCRINSNDDVGYGKRKKLATELLPRPVMVPQNDQLALPETNRSQLLASFSFEDLKRLHHLEEKVEEIITVLALNTGTLSDLKATYMSTWNAQRKRIPSRSYDVQTFYTEIMAFEKDLDIQSIRAKALLKKVQERKIMLKNNLQYRSMAASEFFADQAQRSSRMMESLTHEMHNLAVQTKQETVSMRIITLVTLFFLPGTFVATFMSTDVLHWEAGKRQYESGALVTYLALSLPMTAVTFGMWYWLYHWVKRKDDIVPFGFTYEKQFNLLRRFIGMR